ncbi:MAG TPA: VOC family protein [Candidatus Saccharimonadales bacterium]|nr:VOC family protein [Candidatus Saccharimonadales bacterium]
MDAVKITATPFLLFDGNCQEAMTFYHHCLGGELTLTKLGDTPMKEAFPEEKHSLIINARIEGGLIDITATDWMASPEFERQEGNNFAIYVSSTKAEDIIRLFNKLKDGAKADRFQELHEMPFGIYGQFYDKYGYQWIFRSDK